MAVPDCWITDSNVQRQLEGLFADVDKEVSTYFERHPDTAELILDGHLGARLADSYATQRVYLDRIAALRQAQGRAPITVRFNVSHITASEGRHGADVGLVLRADITFRTNMCLKSGVGPVQAAQPIRSWYVFGPVDLSRSVRGTTAACATMGALACIDVSERVCVL